MRVLAYEVRRLRSLRSTWLIVATVVVCNVATAAVLTVRLPGGPLSARDAVRAVTALVPLLPLPFAALGAGALGALSYGHEVRHPGLAASRVRLGRRLALVAAKLAVLTPVALLLAVLTLTLDALVVRIALPPEVTVGALADPALLRPELFAAAPPAALVHSLPAFAALVLLSGWAGLLITSVVRSAAAGVLLLAALPVLMAPAVGLALRQAGGGWPVWARELMPFRYGLERLDGLDLGSGLGVLHLGAPSGSPSAGAVALAGALAVPAVLLVLAGVLVQIRRRAL
ncbi:hypothetical protein OG871_25455 [Kitasatospora sp. NBC_00374]|uniref:hypothetical protein n=1 Tax=Kitasatospora sp. NBC_00374 TaxID=2975964 RepID=UPI003250FD3A